MTELNKTFPNENNWRDVEGFLQRMETVPTYTPRGIFEQVVLVTNGSSSRVYFYEPIATAWRYTQLS